MTTDSAPMQDPQDNQPPVEAATEAAVKPKRTRRPKAVDVSEASSAPEATEAVVPAAAAEAVAPVAAKRAPRRRKTVEEAPAPQAAEVTEVVAAAVAVAVELAAPAAADEVDAPVAAAPKRAPRRKPAAVAQTEAVAPAAMGEANVVADAAVTAVAPKASAGRAAPVAEDGDLSEASASEGAPGAQSPGEDPTEFRGARRAAMAQQQAAEVFAELLSGDFDKAHEEESEDAASAEPAGPYKRVLRPEPDAPKLQKVLAQAGVGSRRDIEQMIEEGRIEVNDQVAHIGQRISHGDRVKVAGKPIRIRIAPPAARILAYHKPVGEVVTHDDPQGRPTVFRRLPRLQNGKWMSVGRLDLNTEGLLLFTNSGELANQLMHPRFGVEREYAVRVLGSLDEPSRERLLAGVDIEGQAASFVSISNGLGEGVNQWYRVVITEGRNREVRKLFDAVGLTVNRLIRVRYGAIVLPRGLRRGVWAELGESDVRAVKSLAGMDRQEADQQQGRGKGGKPQPQRGQQAEGQRGGGQQGGQQGGQRAGQGPNGQQPGQRGQQGQRGQGQQGRDGRDGRDGRGGQGGRPQQGGGQFGQGGQRGQGPRGQGQQGNHERAQMSSQAPQGARDADDDFDHIGPIPNPLEQTFDKRFVKGSKRITSGFGRPDQDHGRDGGAKAKGPKQPDPLQTAVGYIGADAYFGGGRSGGNRRGGSGGGGGGGGGRGRR
ncbi:23S rRNA pseudouridine2605 synthase [Aquabacterium commune]|uniref:Pseudouridine synthase n=1 Tax=Aquabacterium commune TaxID=70586 RepID=A0A4R6REQ4_9BURK|nr:pseudouridine synthase [Aquabacterium commune]TDP84644.1 23S rRNA pseudouridine2605 synthase [Aquabacterium commune]